MLPILAALGSFAQKIGCRFSAAGRQQVEADRVAWVIDQAVQISLTPLTLLIFSEKYLRKITMMTLRMTTPDDFTDDYSHLAKEKGLTLLGAE